MRHDYPLMNFSQFLPSFRKDELLDFGLYQTPLIKTSKEFCDYIGVKSCYLKMETQLPTKTMKDRITELMFSQFKKQGIKHYALASTGNTAASLAWGMEKYDDVFSATVFISSEQLEYHTFKKPKNMRTVLLENATYDQAFLYAQRYSTSLLKSVEKDAMIFLRYQAGKISYLEAFFQAQRENLKLDLVCQSVSAGVGIIGADKAIQDCLSIQMFDRYPKIIIGQPSYANPIVSCYNSGREQYDHQFTIMQPKKSLAWPIRRGNGEATFGIIKEILDKSNGFAFSASEEKIALAKAKLYEIEGINAGHASCVVIAGLNTNKFKCDFSCDTCLIMLTGQDRNDVDIVEIDQIMKESEWKKIGF